MHSLEIEYEQPFPTWKEYQMTDVSCFTFNCAGYCNVALNRATEFRSPSNVFEIQNRLDSHRRRIHFAFAREEQVPRATQFPFHFHPTTRVDMECTGLKNMTHV